MPVCFSVHVCFKMLKTMVQLQILAVFLLAVRRGFPLSRMTTKNTKSALRNFAIVRVLPFPNNPKELDLSYKTDLDFWDCFGRKKFCQINREIWYFYISQSIYCFYYNYSDLHPNYCGL